MLTTDYLIIGSGTAGMSFADQLLTDTNATIGIIDRHHMPGGHWNDAYSFVRLHQPSAFYGVGSRQLGSNRIDVSSLNRGYYELASGPEIVSYFDRLMQERFLPSGRVQYFPMCDHLGDGRFVSLVSGTIQQVAFSKKLVHATFLNTQVPSTHTPSFRVAEGVKLVTPNLLPISAPGHQRYVILGGGKTAMDVGTWLLQMGVRPENIRWIVPRDFLGTKSRHNSARRRLFRAHRRRNGRQVGGGGRSHLGRGSLRAAGTKRSDVTHRSDCAADGVSRRHARDPRSGSAEHYQGRSSQRTC